MTLARCIIATVLVLLVLPSGANAALPYVGAPLASTRITASLNVVRAFWGASPSCGPVRVFAASSAVMDSATRLVGREGAAGGCDIWILDSTLRRNDYSDRIATCTLLAHEYGHLLGIHEHTTDQRSIMRDGDWAYNAVVYECYRRFLPRGMGRQWRELHGGPPQWLGRGALPVSAGPDDDGEPLQQRLVRRPAGIQRDGR